MTVRESFSDQDLEAIRTATREAESETGGELVCVIVNRCDTYLAPIWQAMALGALGGAVTAGVAHWFLSSWVFSALPWIVMPSSAGAALGLLTVWWIPALRRGLVPREILTRRVDRRAASAFLDEEVFATRDRTGVLLFVALFEHQIRILPDRGVRQRIADEDWQTIASQLTLGIRSGRRAAAIVEAIQACGRLLVERQISRRQDDRNELTDEPRIFDE